MITQDPHPVFVHYASPSMSLKNILRHVYASLLRIRDEKCRAWIRITQDDASKIDSNGTTNGRKMIPELTDVVGCWKYVRDSFGALTLGELQMGLIEIMIEQLSFNNVTGKEYWPRNNQMHKWKQNLQNGDIVNARDQFGKWYESVVSSIDHVKRVVRVHFLGYSHNIDREISFEGQLITEVEPLYTMTDNWRANLRPSDLLDYNKESDINKPAMWVPAYVLVVDHEMGILKLKGMDPSSRIFDVSGVSLYSDSICKRGTHFQTAVRNFLSDPIAVSYKVNVTGTTLMFAGSSDLSLVNEYFEQLSMLPNEISVHRQSSVRLVDMCRPSILSSAFASLDFASMEKFMYFLIDSKSFLRKFVLNSNSFDYILDWYSDVVNDWIYDLRTFQSFRDRWIELTETFGLQKITVPDDPLQDVSDIRQDMEFLNQQLSRIAHDILSVPDLHEQLGDLRQQCNDMFQDWEDQCTDLNILHTTVSDFISHTNHTLEQANDMNIGNELHPIRRSLEDYIRRSVQFPQHLIVIDKLNTSIIEALNKSMTNQRSEIIAQFEQLKSTLLTLQSNANTEILDSLHRLQFSQKEELIRNERLARLELYSYQVTVEESSFLGRGTFGEVKLGIYGGRSVAVKVLTTPERDVALNNQEKKSIDNEVLSMSICSHPSILQLYGYCKVNPRTVYLVLELCSCSLWSYLTDRERNKTIPKALCIAWMKDIISALCYLHERRLIHRDIKAENVLLTDGQYCKVTDFGLSKQQMSTSFGKPSQTHVGTQGFDAPELHDGKQSHRSDVYSFGVTCYQILSRSPPPLKRKAAILNYLASQVELIPKLNEMISFCLESDPKNRISSSEALVLLQMVQDSYPDPRLDQANQKK